MGNKLEYNKFEAVMSDNDLRKISSYFLENYQNDAQTHIDGIYFFMSFLNGDRAAEKAIATKIEDIKLAHFTVDSDQEPSVTIQYIKRRLLNGKTGMRDAYAVVPRADDTELIQPYKLITAS